MRTSKQPYPITTLVGLQQRIDPRPDYQRPAVWTSSQKQLLIDTILRGYDIPKLYWQRMPKDAEFDFEVIDGQQRLRAIWEFCEGGFALARNMDPIEGEEVASLRYDQLDIDLRSQFDIYPIDVVIVEEAIQNEDEDEVRDMFLRLQNGTTLKAQEKRNAMPGQMRDFVKELAKHPFFESCKFQNSRFTFDHVAAQMVCLEMNEGATSVRDADLNRMYDKHKQFDTNSPPFRKLKRVLDYLLRAFPEKTPELERYNAITLYCLASKLLGSYVHDETEQMLAQWFIDFETERWENAQLDEDKRDPQLIEYRRLTSQSTDGEDSITWRLEFMERKFFSAFPEIELLDKTRTFTQEQRLAIFRKDDGHCQLKISCAGEQLGWENWHADHIRPYSRGGKTTVANGQVACAACNLYKSNSEEVGISS